MPADQSAFNDELIIESLGTAVVIGATGGIGRSLYRQLQQDTRYQSVVGCARGEFIFIDLQNEQSIIDASQRIANDYPECCLIIDATGVLEDKQCQVEKSWRQLDPHAMRHAFEINTIGPALLIKHFFPLFPKNRRCIFATLSARVGSIGDNHLGGWYSYRASKAALNQLVHTAAIELRRFRPDAICVALHPGTVATDLSEKFTQTRLNVQTPELAAQRILDCIEHLTPSHSGGFYDQIGKEIMW